MVIGLLAGFVGALVVPVGRLGLVRVLGLAAPVHQRVRQLPAAEAQRGDEERRDGPLQGLAGTALQRGRRGRDRLGGRRDAARGRPYVPCWYVVRWYSGGAVNAGSGGRMRGISPIALTSSSGVVHGGLLAGGGGAVVDERAHGELGQPAVDAGPHLVGGDQADVLGQARTRP